MKITAAILDLPDLGLKVTVCLNDSDGTRVIEIDTPGFESNETPFRIWLNDERVFLNP